VTVQKRQFRFVIRLLNAVSHFSNTCAVTIPFCWVSTCKTAVFNSYAKNIQIPTTEDFSLIDDKCSRNIQTATTEDF
jgi:hypothetical protein